MDELPQSLKHAAALYARGDLEGAREEADAALRADPNNPALCQFMGIVLCRLGYAHQGLFLLRHAVKLRPTDQTARLTLASALIVDGKPAEAEIICAPRAASRPTNAPLMRTYGEALSAQGRNAEAAGAFRQATSLDPNDFEAWHALGNALRSQNDLGAAPALERARQLRGDLPMIHLNYALALRDAGQYAESLSACEEAVKLAPNDPRPLIELGYALSLLGQNDAAIRALRSAESINPNGRYVLLALGIVHTAANERGEAERALRQAIERHPQFALAYSNLGILLESGNRLDELEALLAQANAAGVARSETAILRASLLLRDGQLEAALEAAKSASDSMSAARAVRAHLIGRIADRMGDDATAFAAFTDMNRLFLAQSPARHADRQTFRRKVERLIEVTTQDWIAGWSDARPETSRPAPTFLVGFPRSGTTLLDTMLMSHKRLAVLSEVNLIPELAEALGDPARLASLGIEDISALRQRYFAGLDTHLPTTTGRLVVDKMPLNMIHAAFIHRVFPDSKLVILLRHPCDVVLSCFMQRFEFNYAMLSFVDLSDTAILYDRVMTLWLRYLELLPLKVHTVRYEAMVEDAESELRALLQHLEVAWDPAVLQYRETARSRGRIRTPSYAQVTEALTTRSIGRWERYRNQMAGVLPILAPWAERLGYPPI